MAKLCFTPACAVSLCLADYKPTNERTTMQAGKRALSTSGVEPFRALVELLYSEKKPGDVATRQLIVEMVAGLLEVYPGAAACPLPVDRMAWGQPLSFNGLYVQQLEEPPYTNAATQQTSHDLVKSLMQGPPDEKEMNQVNWLASSHRARPFRKWVEELTGIISDFFWIFCHSSNTIPTYDVDKGAPGPQVPGGMSDGVEAIAMRCCVSRDFAELASQAGSKPVKAESVSALVQAAHLRLLNALVQTAPNLTVAHQLHADMFSSGFERALLVRFTRLLVDFSGPCGC